MFAGRDRHAAGHSRIYSTSNWHEQPQFHITMRLPKRRGGLPVLATGLRQLGARQTPRRPHDSDGPVPARGVRAFLVGPGRAGLAEPRMGLPKQRGGGVPAECSRLGYGS